LKKTRKNFVGKFLNSFQVLFKWRKKHQLLVASLVRIPSNQLSVYQACKICKKTQEKHHIRTVHEEKNLHPSNPLSFSLRFYYGAVSNGVLVLKRAKFLEVLFGYKGLNLGSGD
jgi:hypothetical protein